MSEIKVWKQETYVKYRYELKTLDATLIEDAVYPHARLTGEFEGSPFKVHYRFKIAHDKITELAIHVRPRQDLGGHEGPAPPCGSAPPNG